MKTFRIPDVNIEFKLPIKGVELEFEVSVSNIDTDSCGNEEEYVLVKYQVKEVLVYKAKLKKYVAASPRLSKFVANLVENEEEYSNMIWNAIVDNSKPDPDYERDSFLGN